jgi:predicted nucleic acid-binding protein
MTSALTKIAHYGDLGPDEARNALYLTHQLGVRLVSPDETLTQSAFDWTLRLGRTAAYDSFYLALAERLGCELWTADRRLRNAVDLPWLRGIE